MSVGGGGAPIAPVVMRGSGAHRASPCAARTQAGKTTMLNCLASAVPGGERIISAEEVFELRFSQAGLSVGTCNQFHAQRAPAA